MTPYSLRLTPYGISDEKKVDKVRYLLENSRLGT